MRLCEVRAGAVKPEPARDPPETDGTNRMVTARALSAFAMDQPLSLAAFRRLAPVRHVPAVRVSVLDGLTGAIDAVAQDAAPTHRFLRYGWYAAALAAYGGRARTVLVEQDGFAVAALPLVGVGPPVGGLAAVPGCYWPFRSFPLHLAAEREAVDALLAGLARTVRCLRIGPAYDDDAALTALLERARVAGWATLERRVATGWRLELRDAAAWPRGSTLRKNRFHEKHLATHGRLDWRFLGGGDWPERFDALAAVEEKSWIAARTDGRDAKFTRAGHGAFWRAAAADPVLAGMMSAAVLCVDDAPAAFSFDLDVGARRYAIANSYDPAFARHSPGKVLSYRNLVRARDGGIAVVDWGAGDSGYKQTIGALEGPALRDWLLVRPGAGALAARLLRGRWAASGQVRC